MNLMTFIEALKEVSKEKNVASCLKIIYTNKQLKPKRLSETAYICEDVVSEKERKGDWIIF